MPAGDEQPEPPMGSALLLRQEREHAVKEGGAHNRPRAAAITQVVKELGGHGVEVGQATVGGRALCLHPARA